MKRNKTNMKRAEGRVKKTGKKRTKDLKRNSEERIFPPSFPRALRPSIMRRV
jgi:hypothetical protein